MEQNDQSVSEVESIDRMLGFLGGEDDARVKIKVAADLYPFEFIAIKAKAKKNGGGWEKEVF